MNGIKFRVEGLDTAHSRANGLAIVACGQRARSLFKANGLAIVACGQRPRKGNRKQWQAEGLPQIQRMASAVESGLQPVMVGTYAGSHLFI